MPFFCIEIKTPHLDLNTGFDSSATIGDVKQRVCNCLNENAPGYDFFSDDPPPEIYKVAEFPDLVFKGSVLSDASTLEGCGLGRAGPDYILNLAGPLPDV